jgi:hypothetical protein
MTVVSRKICDFEPTLGLHVRAAGQIDYYSTCSDRC